MNKFKSSFKGSPAPPARKPEPESDLMASYEEDPRGKPAAELDLQLVSDDARSQLADILGRVDGKKDIVIQPELLSLLDHVTPLGILKK